MSHLPAARTAEPPAQVPCPQAARSAAPPRPLRLWSAGDAARLGPPEVSILIVSYNTRALTLKAIETLLAAGGDVLAEVIVYDNASQDGSAEAIRERFPQIQTVASLENLGFAKANNLASQLAHAEMLLLLNPDTETYANAVANLLAFARRNPQGGIYGGRTVFPDGSLNPGSCCNRISIHSQLCRALYLDKIFPGSGFFNAEAIGNWKRDSERRVDVVVGCFLMIPKALWDRLGGFDLKYFMYGEEADLCHRARALGYTPMVTPEATIMHLVGASTNVRAEKILLVGQARATLIREHWAPWSVPIGLFLLWLWSAVRFFFYRLQALVSGRPDHPGRLTWDRVWRERNHWLRGYEEIQD
ncbi:MULTISPECIES: glycosyltransferase family 2 protein [unclassified Salipiger]|uniref:glycosyltransferase family 2 protein n=1 Tax=unclassified Salipiger TaxID=2640570 RepID=UPI0013B80FDB|nr:MULTISPECIES: glycosyltransferase family 2 protein [unclassified Salipiger]NDV48809.1 glycosyltransferase family 2 protein [Salipiger sp. PrR003]NDW31712.1 glycosyltransferase family 2 protein [Salipiger sp. PrR007]